MTNPTKKAIDSMFNLRILLVVLVFIGMKTKRTKRHEIRIYEKEQNKFPLPNNLHSINVNGTIKKRSKYLIVSNILFIVEVSFCDLYNDSPNTRTLK